MERDIDRSHRVGKVVPAVAALRTNTATSEPRQETKKPRPRSIIVKFTSYRKRKEILEKRRKLKNTGISIVEDLTTKNQKLLATTRSTQGVQSAWSSDGRIIALIPASGGKSITKLITCDNDLQHIITH